MEFAWRPGIGDPTLAGWLTVVCYLLAAGSSYILARNLTRHGEGALSREVLAWRALAVLFVLLGVNKQLDLQSAFTELGRHLAYAQGWYEQRQSVQVAFVGGIAVAGMLAGLVVLFLLRDVAWQTWIALIGTGAVLVFVVIRAASFHHVDAFISERFAGLRWNVILEIGGLLVVLLGAWLRAQRLRSQA